MHQTVHSAQNWVEVGDRDWEVLLSLRLLKLLMTLLSLRLRKEASDRTEEEGHEDHEDHVADSRRGEA